MVLLYLLVNFSNNIDDSVVSVEKTAAFFTLFFFLTYADSNLTLHLTLGLVGMHLDAANIWVVSKFS